MSHTTLMLFTAQFPYGKQETFLESEIGILGQRFEKIFIFPLLPGKGLREIPDNCEVVSLFDPFPYQTQEALLNHGPSIVQLWVKEMAQGAFTNGNPLFTFSSLCRIHVKADLLHNWISKHQPQNPLFYCYWFEEWATILGILKKRKTLSSYVSRAHGFDLYEERNEYGRIPFRNFQLNKADQIICISNNGQQYLQSRYPAHHNKFITSYLGTVHKGLNPLGQTVPLQIISCSNVIPLKRLHLLIAIFQKVKIKVKWVHFGDGPLMEEIQTLAKELPENIESEFSGRVSNEELLSYYQETPIHLFINVSDTEGLPVSIMEAISFGIPIIATDVGGTSEIVTTETGTLIPSDFEPAQVSQLINDFPQNIMITEGFRKNVRVFWEKNFNAEKNFHDFVDLINPLTHE